MLLAALLAMVLVASSPAWAQQTSGPAVGAQAVDAAHAGNVCVQALQNVNSGNVSQEQAAANINEQIGQLAEAAATATGDNASAEANAAVEGNVTQTVNQSITQNQQGISQTNNAFQLANQTLNRR